MAKRQCKKYCKSFLNLIKNFNLQYIEYQGLSYHIHKTNSWISLVRYSRRVGAGSWERFSSQRVRKKLKRAILCGKYSLKLYPFQTIFMYFHITSKYENTYMPYIPSERLLYPIRPTFIPHEDIGIGLMGYESLSLGMCHLPFSPHKITNNIRNNILQSCIYTCL